VAVGVACKLFPRTFRTVGERLSSFETVNSADKKVDDSQFGKAADLESVDSGGNS
jgi:hypothetical protein